MYLAYIGRKNNIHLLNITGKWNIATAVCIDLVKKIVKVVQTNRICGTLNPKAQFTWVQQTAHAGTNSSIVSVATFERSTVLCRAVVHPSTAMGGYSQVLVSNLFLSKSRQGHQETLQNHLLSRYWDGQLFWKAQYANGYIYMEFLANN